MDQNTLFNNKRIVVNPYITSINHDHIPSPSVVKDPTLREELSRRHRADDLEVFINGLDDTLVVVGKEDRAFLQRYPNRPILVEELSTSEVKIAGRLYGVLLLSLSDVWRKHNYKWLDVEINTHCNYRCTFCPVSTSPFSKQFMSDELFELVLQRMSDYGARIIGFDFFNEPALDPKLLKRIRCAKDYGVSVKLYSNGSLLDEEKLRAIAEIGILTLTINLPTIDPEEFSRVTKSKLLHRVIENIETACQLGIATSLSVNTPQSQSKRDLRAINRRFHRLLGKHSVAWPTGSRGGSVDVGEYAPDVDHGERLTGCMVALHKMNISVDGTALLCCEDFERKYVLGNIRQSSLKELGESDAAVLYRKRSYGWEPASPDFICRGCRATGAQSPDRFRCGTYPFPEGRRGKAAVEEAFRNMRIMVTSARSR
jgi:radical SAM protein with 4Fe4S-binding SPASM domain